MKTSVKTVIAAVCFALCLVTVQGQSAQQSLNGPVIQKIEQSPGASINKRPAPGTVPGAVQVTFDCARLSEAIQADKAQYTLVLRYLADLNCYNEPQASSVQCQQLLNKRDNLLARIELNQRRAAQQNCGD